MNSTLTIKPNVLGPGHRNRQAVGIAASAVCDGDDLTVTITAGDGPFNITGTGSNLPVNGVGLGAHVITGPASWTGITVTELGGNGQVLVLGDIECPEV